MLGTSPKTLGGIASVIKAYRSSGLFDNWSISYIETHSDGGFIRKGRFAIVAWTRYLAMLFQEKEILVHVHGASRASFWRKSTFIIPAIWAGVPFIFHLHGGGFMQFYGDECGRLAKAFVRYVLNKSATIIVLSESWLESMRTIASIPDVVVLPNPGPSPPAAGEAMSRDTSTILFLGRVCEEKGIFVLMEAFAKVLEEFPQAQLMCAGDGELRELAELARELNINDRVEMLGWVDEKQRTELLLTSSIFVLPSFTEGLPMSILEAMSASLPVIATPVGGIPDVIRNEETGILVPVSDVISLSAAICRLLGDSALRESIGRRAQAEFKMRFDLDVVIPQLESIYRNLGARRKTEEKKVLAKSRSDGDIKK